MDLYIELQSLLTALQRNQIDYALCGGFALAVYGIIRATEDIDVMILESTLPHVRQTVEPLGFRLAARPLRFHEDQVEIRRLVKTWPNSEDYVVLDLLLVSPLLKPAWESRRIVNTEWGAIRVVSPVGLIFLKSLRDSGQDKDDVRRLKELSDED
jgi:hypothetical protein